MSNEPELFLQILTPYPELAPGGPGIPLNPRVTAVSISADTASGWNRCQIGYRVQVTPDRTINAYLPEPVEVDDGAVVKLTSGADVLFVGVATEANEGSISADGLGLWAPRWAQISQGGAERVTLGTIVGAAAENCPWLRFTEVVDTGVMHAWSELQYRTLGDAINQMLSEGGAVGGQHTPWMFLVYDDPGSELGLARLVPKLPSSVPDYVWSYDREVMPVSWQFDLVDAVRVTYGSGQTTPWAYRGGVDPDSRWLRRETLAGGGATIDGAIAVAQTYLTQHSTPQLAGPVTLREWRGLAIRPGETVRMLGLGDVLVTQVQHDLFSGVSQIQLGDPSIRSWVGWQKQIQRAVVSLGKQRNMISGATS